MAIMTPFFSMNIIISSTYGTNFNSNSKHLSQLGHDYTPIKSLHDYINYIL